ncbi:winged helix-turn-helix domain-containing protein [Acaryochloris sp. IP29b_bin.137]|uniref:winged helix-turn-helix domain-containing protein n=1 Tax=Acaryochloris sp. IP29b_bin.137 TaxID=2969217 RepID=UPI00344E0D3C
MTEYELLGYLLKHSRKSLTREPCFDTALAFSIQETFSVNHMYIRNLRLNAQLDVKKHIISTVCGVGYVL